MSPTDKAFADGLKTASQIARAPGDARADDRMFPGGKR